MLEGTRDRKVFRPDLRRARHLLCCDGLAASSYVSDWELAGLDAQKAYRVIVRIYLPRRPRKQDVRAAAVALRALRLPPPQ
jgi:hypothetical protein